MRTFPLDSYFTFSFYLFIGGITLCSKVDEKASCEKYLILTAVNACFVLGSIIGVIETVFWGAIFLPIKTIALCLPDEMGAPMGNWFAGRVFLPLIITTFSFIALGCDGKAMIETGMDV